jgi:leucyl-tRNA synthetase
MRMLRNQGQILGEERAGDFVAASGRREGDKLFADRIEVCDPRDVPVGFDGVAGEILSRAENVLRVADRSGRSVRVEVGEGTRIEIPSIPGANQVSQLRHHLEIQRMSKSKGNVVSPDDLVARWGADTVRAYLMFAFDWEKGGPWDSQGALGVVRFIREVWELVHAPPPQGSGEGSRELARCVHAAIARVGQSLERFSFNTAVAALMTLRNDLRAALREGRVDAAAWREALRTLLLLMAPITPHVAEELWSRLGLPYSIHQQAWPALDPELLLGDVVTLAVQVNGRRRDEIRVPADADEAAIRAAALAAPGVRRHLGSAEPRKVIVVPGRLVNVIV